eukprot:CAMPEP_0196580086 /NCGR_PEP_ID=MMETSP1081-20130531/26924_1 /TAXON_ID=36882 /ORGANISM="Pyramimonas amylifera, Strain CCMP720" /LENGTH=254 /DNA_ID=CAMNT_0041899869 /DNA_START=146 /DNA_END=910 /DNA_ORIENTATION=-
MPTIYIPHGGGPYPLMNHAKHLELIAFLKSLPETLPYKPTAILVVSAHWEESTVTIQSHPNPPMLFDYGGFPPHTYEYTYPARNDATINRQVVSLLDSAGIQVKLDEKRGFDHGVFVPLLLMYPNADIPVFQISLLKSLNPRKHLELGQALSSLRDDGVLILGSGLSYHNFDFDLKHSKLFDQFLVDSVVDTDANIRNLSLENWAKGPSARAAHPREEHLIPLMVCAGAAGESRGKQNYGGPVLGVTVSAFRFD